MLNTSKNFHLDFFYECKHFCGWTRERERVRWTKRMSGKNLINWIPLHPLNFPRLSLHFPFFFFEVWSEILQIANFSFISHSRNGNILTRNKLTKSRKIPSHPLNWNFLSVNPFFFLHFITCWISQKERKKKFTRKSFGEEVKMNLCKQPLYGIHSSRYCRRCRCSWLKRKENSLSLLH